MDLVYEGKLTPQNGKILYHSNRLYALEVLHVLSCSLNVICFFISWFVVKLWEDIGK